MMRANEKIIKLIQEKKYIEAEKIINSLKGEIIKNNELFFLSGSYQGKSKKIILKLKAYLKNFSKNQMNILMVI
jgi:hypothetical protein